MCSSKIGGRNEHGRKILSCEPSVNQILHLEGQEHSSSAYLLFCRMQRDIAEKNNIIVRQNNSKKIQKM